MLKKGKKYTPWEPGKSCNCSDPEIAHETVEFFHRCLGCGKLIVPPDSTPKPSKRHKIKIGPKNREAMDLLVKQYVIDRFKQS